MRLGVKTSILALVVALLAVPAAFAKGGHGGGNGGGHGKPAWAGGGHATGHAKADKSKAKQKKHGRAGAESELTREDLEGLNPAWYCKTLRTMMEDDGQDFYDHFGTNANDANAPAVAGRRASS